MILLDEWVAYARNLVSQGDLPAGTFDAQLSFAQQLTEATKQVPSALLLISVPQSRNEIGGSDGQVACDGLKNVVTRLAYQWRPATGNESFEIVRRRLFEPIATSEDGANRDAVVRSFTDLYAANKADFLPKLESPATATCSLRRIRSTQNFSSGSTKTGAPSIASNAHEASCVCSPSPSKAFGAATARIC